MSELKTCKVCGLIVSITPVYAEVGDAESGPQVEIVDVLSTCECGNDVLDEPCELCNGEGCYECTEDVSKIV